MCVTYAICWRRIHMPKNCSYITVCCQKNVGMENKWWSTTRMKTQLKTEATQSFRRKWRKVLHASPQNWRSVNVWCACETKCCKWMAARAAAGTCVNVECHFFTALPLLHAWCIRLSLCRKHKSKNYPSFVTDYMFHHIWNPVKAVWPSLKLYHRTTTQTIYCWLSG